MMKKLDRIYGFMSAPTPFLVPYCFKSSFNRLYLAHIELVETRMTFHGTRGQNALLAVCALLLTDTGQHSFSRYNLLNKLTLFSKADVVFPVLHVNDTGKYGVKNDSVS